TVDLDAVGLVFDVGERALEQVFGGAVQVAKVDAERGVRTEGAAPVGVALDAAADVAEHPRVRGPDRPLPQTRLGKRPEKGVLRAGRAVDSDDDRRPTLRVAVLVLTHCVAPFPALRARRLLLVGS